MPKFPLKWHEDCYASMVKVLKEKCQIRARIESEIEKLNEEIIFVEEQINEAKKRGLAAFDPDKFLKRRKAK